jgi:hypothetical protein
MSLELANTEAFALDMAGNERGLPSSGGHLAFYADARTVGVLKGMRTKKVMALESNGAEREREMGTLEVAAASYSSCMWTRPGVRLLRAGPGHFTGIFEPIVAA